MTGVEQQRRAALDADIAQPQEQRAVRLAMALDAKQLAAGIRALDFRLKIPVQPPLPNLSDVAAKEVEEIRTNARTVRARMANLPGSSYVREISSNRRRRHRVSLPAPRSPFSKCIR
jgi:hypothetical protein